MRTRRSIGLVRAIRAALLCSGAILFLAAPAFGESAPEPSATQPQTVTPPSPPETAGVPSATPEATQPPTAEIPTAEAPEMGTPGAEQVVVTAARTELLGTAQTSSQGIILKQELTELPAYRPAQLLETVPGLVVTSHSGEGKANQYLLRGFNLDHGTDLATFVDGMPVNMRTHAHGQGYTDLNFMIGELTSGIDFTKGPYFAAEGDYSSVGAVHLGYVNELPDQATVSIGTLGYQRVFGAMTRDLSGGHILSALELNHYDGPWTHPDNVRKVNAVLRYSEGEAREGWSLTGMYYRGLWNATTDQPERAMDPAYMASLGLTPIDRFGTLDPTDAGQAQRMSLSGAYSHGTLDWHVDANAYLINSNLTLWNNFTHFLNDPVNGDQEAQNDVRTILGGGASYTRYGMLFGANSEILVGTQARWDTIHVDRLTTKERVPLSVTIDDRVKEGSVGFYGQVTDYWSEWLRTIVGVREDYYSATDSGTNAGSGSAALFQPKGSIIVTPFDKWEFYISAGRGFHSNDFRGVTGGGAFLVPSFGDEIGVRTTPIQNLTATVTLFQMRFDSELTYDPDVGQTSAGRASKRTGVEINATYTPFEWLEVYGSVAFTHARYSEHDPAGDYIPDAPAAIGNLGIYLRNLDGWSAALEYRYLGPHPLIEDNSVRSVGDQEWNMNVGYDFGSGWKAQLGVFNLFDSTDDAADYYYVDRLPGEPANGVADLHIHPLEPRNYRFTVTKTF